MTIKKGEKEKHEPPKTTNNTNANNLNTTNIQR